MTAKAQKKAIRSMEEFERRFFPKDYARKQREKRIEEVGEGTVMAEETLERVFGKRGADTSVTAEQQWEGRKS